MFSPDFQISVLFVGSRAILKVGRWEQQFVRKIFCEAEAIFQSQLKIALNKKTTSISLLLVVNFEKFSRCQM